MLTIRGKYTVSVKPANHSENISDFKTSLRQKLKHHTEYVHGGEFHHHLYSLSDLNIRETGLENITAAGDHEAGPVCCEHEVVFFPVMSHMRHRTLLFTSHRPDHQQLMAQVTGM